MLLSNNVYFLLSDTVTYDVVVVVYTFTCDDRDIALMTADIFVKEMLDSQHLLSVIIFCLHCKSL